MEHQLPNGNHWLANPSFLHSKSLSPVPSLWEIKDVLANELRSVLKEVTVDVASCPCLTREPFNLAGVGLCGNTSLIEVGGYSNFIPIPRRDLTVNWNILSILSLSCHNSFIIGTGYAAKPYMPYNGHLIMNATYEPPGRFSNASRIVFADASNGHTRIEMVTGSGNLTGMNQMMCSYMGSFFVSEGNTGLVLKLRARGKGHVDIISLIQTVLYRSFRRRTVALGGVLKIRYGCVSQNVMPEEYPRQVTSFDDFSGWLQCQNIECISDLIAVGTLVNTKPKFSRTQQRYGYYLPERHHQFHSFSNYGAGGQFINETTDNITEYEGYFNVAETIYYTDYCT